MEGIKWNFIQIQKEISDYSSIGWAWISLLFLPVLLWYVTQRNREEASGPLQCERRVWHD